MHPESSDAPFSPPICVFPRATARIPTVHDEAQKPSPVPDIPEGAMLTCSVDGTVRVWHLGALDGRAGGEEGHSGRCVRGRRSILMHFVCVCVFVFRYFHENERKHTKKKVHVVDSRVELVTGGGCCR